MLRPIAMATSATALLLAVSTRVCAQQPAPPVDLVAAQQAAIEHFAPFDGLWRGNGWSLVDGERAPLIVTQRVGRMLDGATQVMETRSYATDGALAFHAFNNIAYDADKAAYVMQARAEGRFGTFPLQATMDGYVWEIGSGGNGLRYTGRIENGVWREVTESLSAGEAPRVIGEFMVYRFDDTDWPEAGALPAK